MTNWGRRQDWDRIVREHGAMVYTTAWRILGGYQFNRNFAAELGYHNLGETKASAPGVDAKIKATVWELVGVGMWPIANQFGVYGKLGAHHSEAKLDSNVGVSGKDTGNGLTFGAGLQYDVMPALGLRAEWQRYQKVGELRDELRLAHQACSPGRISGKGVRENLDRDDTLQTRIARLEDFTHAAGADRREDLVWSQSGASSNGHG